MWTRVPGLLVVTNLGHAPEDKTLVNSTVTVWPTAQRTSKLNRPGVQLAFVSTSRPPVAPPVVINEKSVNVAR